MDRIKKVEGGFVIEERYSAWQKKKVRTILVNSHSKSAFQRFITAALSIAEPNDRIELSGGDYSESISLTIPIELVASDGEEPRITARTSPITVAAGVKVYLENLVVVCKGANKSDAALMLMGGTICCHSCWLSSVLIGGGARVEISDCVISKSSSGYGLVVQDSGGGHIARTIIHSHSFAAAEIDTYEELVLEKCTLFNSAAFRGNVLMLSSGVGSIAVNESFRPVNSCSRVKIMNCVIYVTRENDRDVRTTDSLLKSSIDEDSMTNVYGVQCCVVIANGASPTLCDNELTEGEIGIYLDFPGAAQIARNIIRLQRRCGILAMVDHGYIPSLFDQQLCIAESNVLDNCCIGIDVVHSSCGRHLSGVNFDAEHLFSPELPTQKQQFNWFSSSDLTKTLPDCALAPDVRKDLKSPAYGPEDSTQRVFFHGTYYSLQNLRSYLMGLVHSVLRAYPVCLNDSFKVVSGAPPVYASEDAAAAGTEKVGNEYAQLIKSSLGLLLSSDSDEKERRKILQRMGNRGVHVSMTKFVNCSLCAIRFGRHSYGIVESCQFEDSKSHAVVIDSGAHPLITGCHFLSSSKAVLVLHKFSEPLIIGNEIAMGSNNGIEANNLSGGVIVANVIQSQLGSGILVTQNSYSLIVANLISRNSQAGIHITNQSTPLIFHNKLYCNTVTHINCSENSSPFIAFNQLHSSPGAGMIFTDCSIGTVYKNAILHNGDGIVLELDADPQVEWNRIKMNLKVGILARNNALGNFVQNDISENTQANVVVSDGAFPVLRHNTISKGLQGGVVVHSEGIGLFEKNHLSENSVANVIVVGPHSEPSFVSNMINSAPSGCGVLCAQNTGGLFVGNHIYENSQYGVYVIDAANPTFRENHIRSEPIGVFVSDRGKGIFQQNQIHCCQSFGVLTTQEGDPVFEDNTIYLNQVAGVLIAPDGVGKYLRNTLKDNGFGVQLGSSLQSTTVNVNSIFVKAKPPSLPPFSATVPFKCIPGNGTALTSIRKNIPSAREAGTNKLPSNAPNPTDQRYPIRLKPLRCQVRGNKIFHNQYAGILLSASCSGHVEENEIYDNTDYGVCADPCYAATCVQSLLQQRPSAISKQLNAVAATPPCNASVLFTKNTIYRNRVANVSYNSWYANDQTDWTENEIYEAPIGFYLGNQSSCNLVEGNRIHHCLDGVYAEFGAVGRFCENQIYDCAFSGLYVSHGAEPVFTRRNVIQRCGLSGVLVDWGGSAKVEETTIRHCCVGAIISCVDKISPELSYKAVIATTHALAPCTFSDNVIEENETHGVLLLSAAKFTPLRVHRYTDPLQSWRNTINFAPPLDSNVTMRSLFSSKDRLFALFARNKIHRNRMCGVFVDRFELSDFVSTAEANELSLLHDMHTPDAARAVDVKSECLISTGFNETDLDTPLMNCDKEQREKLELRNVTFRENVIRECGVGFATGYGRHPFLLDNKIECNVFFGLLLRSNSGLVAHQNVVCENGIAGVYAAKGSRGVISGGRISENNTFCRYPGNKNQTRNFSDFIFSKNFFEQPWDANSAGTAPSLRSTMEAPPLPLSPPPSLEESRARLASEPLMHLARIHTYSLAEAIQLLCEFVSASSASSAGMTLATTCCPSAAICDDVPVSLGGVAVPNFIRMCTSDGGIGVWIEQGSFIKICCNEIKANSRIGVLYSKGIVHHHSILVPAFVVKQKKGASTYNPPPKSNFQQAENDGEVVKSLERVLSLPRPRLASDQKGFLFTSDALTTSSPATRGEGQTGGALTSPPLPSRGFRKSGDAVLTYAAISDNEIHESDYSVYIQHYQALREDPCGAYLIPASKSPLLSAKPPFFSSSSPPQVGPPSAPLTPTAVSPRWVDSLDLSTMTDHPLPLPTSFSARRVTLLVERNTIARSRQAGVYAEHVVEVLCDKTQRVDHGILTAAVEKSYSDVLSSMLMRKTLPVSGGPLFRLTPVPVDAGQVWVTHNKLSGNAGPQVEVSSRYVVVFADATRTLLQFDTMASPRHSNYVSRILKEIEPFGSFLQHPPVESCIFDSNVFSDAKHGVRVAGYVGSIGARFQRNKFENLSVGILVEGHLAACTVGVGNIFLNNLISLKIDVTPSLYRSKREETDKENLEAQNDLRTRVFNNVFKSSRDCSVLVSSSGDRSVLLYHNEFFGHVMGSSAVYLTAAKSHRDHEGTVIVKNIFSEGYTSLVVNGQAPPGTDEKMVPQKELCVIPSVAAENIFIGNYIGALVCKGASLHLVGNLFDSNFRCGLEVSGIDTKFQARDCVFRCHYAPLMSRNHLSASSSVIDPKYARFPPNSSLPLLMGTVLVELMPENKYLLNLETQHILVAGILADTFVEGVVERCTFTDNELGVDATRDARQSSMTTLDSTLKFISCVFSRNRVAGILLRASVTSNNNSIKDLESTYVAKAEIGQGAWSENKDVNEFREATTIQGCYFSENMCDRSTCGDVVTINASHGMFRDNLFHGTVHGMESSHAVFMNNFFQESNPNTQQDSHVRCPAVVLHSRSRLILKSNFFSHYKKAILALPGASGVVRSNFLHRCGTGITIAPHNCTIFKENKIFLSHKCGVLTYGGLFASNEIFGGTTGMIVQPGTEYKGIEMSADYHNRDDIPLCSYNTICGCESNGILVQGAATLEGNTISSCENGFKMVSFAKLVSGEKVPVAKGNSVYSNGVGFYLDDDSISTLQNNDIFDNKIYGVLVMESATGTLQSNRISTIDDCNAIKISTASHFKQTGNIIRCQFSPGGGKVDIAANRSKEFGKKSKTVEKDIEVAEKELTLITNKAHKMYEASELTANRMLDELSSRIPALSEDSVAAVIALRTQKKCQNLLALMHGERRQTAPSTPITDGLHLSIVSQDGVLGSREGNVAHGGSRSRLGPNATFLNQIEEAEQLPHPEDGRFVLIHVVSRSKATATSNSIGQIVASVLCAPCLAHAHFKTTVTAGHAELISFLKCTESIKPFIMIVVVGLNLCKISPKYVKSLESLFKTWETLSEVAGPTFNAFPQFPPEVCCPLLYMIFPKSFSSIGEMSPRSKKAETRDGDSAAACIGMLQERAKRAHMIFYYQSRVSDVLPKIQEAIVQRMLPNQPISTDDVRGPPASCGGVGTGASTLDIKENIDILPKAPIRLQEPPSKEVFRKHLKSSSIARERVEDILSKVKPSPSAGKKTPRRDKKSSMAVSHPESFFPGKRSRQLVPVFFTPDLCNLRISNSDGNEADVPDEAFPSQLHVQKARPEVSNKSTRSPSFPSLKVQSLQRKRV
ncbi:unnamed protein product [Phytomonas sp. EM1]|nr:unnamed protein product [Phytomonas sp. EM1]|eukprot:CCW60992.1 unnamed protein product [Phytomonas sp. isolate EM1]